MLGETKRFARADAGRITIIGADHWTLRRISCRYANQRVQIQLMMGGLTTTVVGMMCKDVANVSTIAGGLEIVALVDIL